MSKLFRSVFCNLLFDIFEQKIISNREVRQLTSVRVTGKSSNMTSQMIRGVVRDRNGSTLRFFFMFAFPDTGLRIKLDPRDEAFPIAS